MKNTLVLLSLVVSACSSPTAIATPTAPPPTPKPTNTKSPPTANFTAAATSTPAATPTATPLPELFQVSNSLGGLLPVGTWDNVYRDPGAVVYHDGQFHMFYNGINGYPRPVGVGYATSADGLKWRPQSSQPVFTLGDVTSTGSYGGPNLFVTSALVDDDGTWVLYYYNLSGSTFEGPQSIGRATAPEPLGPWTPDPTPVLLPGAGDAWDHRQVSSPTVIKTDEGYVMYYDGTGRTSMIGMATSPDGKNWTKHNDPATTEAAYADSDPVLMPTGGAWDARRVLDPNVVQTETGWVMVYLSTDGSQKFNGKTFGFGLATSPDGLAWTKLGAEPILTNQYHPSWMAIYLSTLVFNSDTWYLYFDTARNQQTSITLATFTGALGQ